MARTCDAPSGAPRKIWNGPKLKTLEEAREANDTRTLFQIIKTLKPFTAVRAHALRGEEGNLLTSEEDTVQRLHDHFKGLLYAPPPAHPVPAAEDRNGEGLARALHSLVLCCRSGRGRRCRQRGWTRSSCRCTSPETPPTTTGDHAALHRLQALHRPGPAQAHPDAGGATRRLPVRLPEEQVHHRPDLHPAADDMIMSAAPARAAGRAAEDPDRSAAAPVAEPWPPPPLARGLTAHRPPSLGERPPSLPLATSATRDSEVQCCVCVCVCV